MPSPKQKPSRLRKGSLTTVLPLPTVDKILGQLAVDHTEHQDLDPDHLHVVMHFVTTSTLTEMSVEATEPRLQETTVTDHSHLAQEVEDHREHFHLRMEVVTLLVHDHPRGPPMTALNQSQLSLRLLA